MSDQILTRFTNSINKIQEIKASQNEIDPADLSLSTSFKSEIDVVAATENTNRFLKRLKFHAEAINNMKETKETMEEIDKRFGFFCIEHF
jgi:hypothetical protein